MKVLGIQIKVLVPCNTPSAKYAVRIIVMENLFYSNRYHVVEGNISSIQFPRRNRRIGQKSWTSAAYVNLQTLEDRRKKTNHSESMKELDFRGFRTKIRMGASGSARQTYANLSSCILDDHPRDQFLVQCFSRVVLSRLCLNPSSVRCFLYLPISPSFAFCLYHNHPYHLIQSTILAV